MEDPREIAWQRRCDYHSRINAIRVAFTATYTQAIPNAHLAQYYKNKQSSLQQWVTRKGELEHALDAAKSQDEEVETEMMFQEQDVVMKETARSAAPRTKSVGCSKNREDAIEKRKAKSDAPVKNTKAKRKRTELQLRGGFDTQMNDSGVIIEEDEESEFRGESGDVTIGGGVSVCIPLLAPTTTTAPVESAPADPPSTITSHPAKKYRKKSSPSVANPPYTNKSKRTSKTRTTVPSTSNASHAESTKSLKSLKLNVKPTSKKGSGGDKRENKGGQGDINYEILPHIPGTTEIIFNRYPKLHKLASVKKGKKRALAGANRDASKGLDINRLIFLCRKASNSANGQNKAMKAGADNSVIGGGGEPVFLRRNVTRVRTRIGAGV